MQKLVKKKYAEIQQFFETKVFTLNLRQLIKNETSPFAQCENIND